MEQRTHLPLGAGLGVALLLCAALALADPASARLYQWVNPDTGYTQLSGKPPAWYRSATAGPRVLVFENGRLVDDTAIELPEEYREQLRRRAMLEADRHERMLSTPAAPSLDEGGAALQVDEPFLNGSDPGLDFELPEPPRPGAAPVAEEESIERLRAVIEAWDRRRTEQARGVLESSRPD